jgi:membrane-associated phospholipid phosphatase
VSRPRRLLLGLAAAFAALAVLVASGALHGLDQWAVDHLMPGLEGTRKESSVLEAAVPLLHSSWSGGLDAVANIVTLPAQVLISSVLFGVCCVVLWRRGRKRAAIAWGSAWIVGNAIEVLTKSTLSRPLLHAHGHAIVAFESSFPSGHTLRAVLLAAVATAVWPAAGRWIVLWAAATLVLLEVAGFHVPSDIAGGLVLALLIVVAVRSASREPSV